MNKYFFNKHYSMADGVEKAWAVVCFLTQAYQDSNNCQAELTPMQKNSVNPSFLFTWNLIGNPQAG